MVTKTIKLQKHNLLSFLKEGNGVHLGTKVKGWDETIAIDLQQRTDWLMSDVLNYWPVHVLFWCLQRVKKNKTSLISGRCILKPWWNSSAIWEFFWISGSCWSSRWKLLPEGHLWALASVLIVDRCGLESLACSDSCPCYIAFRPLQYIIHGIAFGDDLIDSVSPNTVQPISKLKVAGLATLIPMLPICF